MSLAGLSGPELLLAVHADLSARLGHMTAEIAGLREAVRDARVKVDETAARVDALISDARASVAEVRRALDESQRNRVELKLAHGRITELESVNGKARRASR